MRNGKEIKNCIANKFLTNCQVKPTKQYTHFMLFSFFII